MLYNVCMYYVTTQDPARLAHWDRLLGVDRLPVCSDQPRLQETRGGTCLAYDLDVSRLRDGQLYRLAAAVARRTGQSYAVALADLRAQGLPVVAADVHVVDERDETAVMRRPFFASVLDRLFGRFQPAA